jgi:hypothetical protein
MPRWGGSYAEIDAEISKAYARLASDVGIEHYSRLYWIYSDLEGESVDIFAVSLADWSLMRNGFRDMAKHHPNSDFVLNGFARFACLAKDAMVYNALRPRLDGHRSPTAWPLGMSIESCDKQFADQGVT